jgi:hypothetical protein
MLKTPQGVVPKRSLAAASPHPAHIIIGAMCTYVCVIILKGAARPQESIFYIFFFSKRRLNQINKHQPKLFSRTRHFCKAESIFESERHREINIEMPSPPAALQIFFVHSR